MKERIRIKEKLEYLKNYVYGELNHLEEDIRCGGSCRSLTGEACLTHSPCFQKKLKKHHKAHRRVHKAIEARKYRATP